jgi:uncharacterized membrane protein
MLYTIVLTLHNLTRWAVLLLAVWVLYRSYAGWLGVRPWTQADRRANALFAAVIGLQFILGVIFYLVPGSLANRALGDLASAMKDSNMRFFVAEHSVVMFVAVVVANIGSAVARRAPTDAAKHRLAAILFTITTLLVLLAIPWPFLSYGRPWLRLG